MHLSWSMTLTQRCSRSPTVMSASGIGGDRQSERRGAVPVVVDVNDLTAGPVQQRRADGRAEAAGAVHPYLAGRNLPGALFQVPERDMDRAGQVDRKSTRLNSSHAKISYAAFGFKKT